MVLTSSDNDQSVLAFTDMTGSNNWWGDGAGSINGAMWSFWNDDYCCGNQHIGNGTGQGYAAVSNTNTGSYEVYVR